MACKITGIDDECQSLDYSVDAIDGLFIVVRVPVESEPTVAPHPCLGSEEGVSRRQMRDSEQVSQMSKRLN
jgi:hypothetical protein